MTPTTADSQRIERQLEDDRRAIDYARQRNARQRQEARRARSAVRNARQALRKVARAGG